MFVERMSIGGPEWFSAAASASVFVKTSENEIAPASARFVCEGSLFDCEPTQHMRKLMAAGEGAVE